MSCAAIVTGGWLYAAGITPAWLTMLSAALLMSLLHELEHDLIHHLYFKDNPLIYNTMMAGVWLFRPSTISPWVRRALHLHHHKSSGLQSDMEERAITLGERFGVRRVLMIFDGMWSSAHMAFASMTPGRSCAPIAGGLRPRRSGVGLTSPARAGARADGPSRGA